MEKRILIVDDPELLTPDNVKMYSEVYPLFSTNIKDVEGIPVIDIPEITESTLPNVEKMKELISEINRRNSFEYEVLTEEKEKYLVHNYICSFKE